MIGLVVSIGLLAAVDLSTLLKGVENRYNRSRTMQMEFEQTQSGQGQIARTESGTLSIQKPGRMRWTYSRPAGKFFLTDGKFAYYYSPNTRQVSRSKIKEAEDLRAPLAFLIGNVDFQRDFKEFRTTPEGANTYIAAIPKSPRAPYTQVDFLVTPDYRIELLKVTGQDGQIMRYKLTGEKSNPVLPASTFQFVKPDGAELIDEDQ
jgi:outer membrane lipoprotein carrier protein